MMAEPNQKRGLWKTRMGFILAASGSAVGLGNVWKFPYIAGQNGGGAFVLVYLICIALVGLPIMLAEFTVGRKTNLNPVGAFQQLKPGTPWVGIGFMGVLAGFLILSFYGVVGGAPASTTASAWSSRSTVPAPAMTSPSCSPTARKQSMASGVRNTTSTTVRPPSASACAIFTAATVSSA